MLNGIVFAFFWLRSNDNQFYVASICKSKTNNKNTRNEAAEMCMCTICTSYCTMQF